MRLVVNNLAIAVTVLWLRVVPNVEFTVSADVRQHHGVVVPSHRRARETTLPAAGQADCQRDAAGVDEEMVL
jgi:hypothetical protein